MFLYRCICGDTLCREPDTLYTCCIEKGYTGPPVYEALTYEQVVDELGQDVADIILSKEFLVMRKS